jgi:hypothetical protein
VAVCRVLLGIQVDDLPAKASELVQKRLLDVLSLVEADLGGVVLGAHDGLLRTGNFRFRFGK